MISGQVTEEVRFFLYCFMMGWLMELIYDVIRIYRRIRPHGVLHIAVQDILYWIVATYVIFYNFNKYNSGIIRWYLIAGIFVGMIVFEKIIGEHLVQFMSTLVKKILHLVSRTFETLFLPVKRLFARFLKKCKMHKKKFSKLVKKSLTGNIKKVKITLCKHKKGRTKE